MKSTFRMVCVAVAAAGIATACGRGSEAVSRTSAPGASPIAGQHLSVSRVKDYESLADLQADARLVVVGTARSTARAEDVNFPASRANFAVARTVYGPSGVSATISVLQTGLPDLLVEGDGQLLTPGKSYVLMLTPFVDGQGAPTGDWYPVGGLGVFQLNGDRAVKTSPLLRGVPAELPSSAFSR